MYACMRVFSSLHGDVDSSENVSHFPVLRLEVEEAASKAFLILNEVSMSLAWGRPLKKGWLRNWKRHPIVSVRRISAKVKCIGFEAS